MSSIPFDGKYVIQKKYNFLFNKLKCHLFILKKQNAIGIPTQ